MSEPIVGSIGVAVVPNAEGFKEKLERDLVPGSSEIGDQIGRAIGSSMSDAIGHSIDEIRAKLDALGLKDVGIRLSVNDDGSIALAEGKVAALDATASNAGNGGVGILHSRLVLLGAAAIAGADVAIPALLAIGAAAAGALAGIGVGLLGFSGIGAALQAHGSPFGGGGGGGGANSQLGQQSAQINAAQATQQAQDQLTQAIQTQHKAELSLHDARVQALQDLQDLDNKLKDNALSQQQAAINLDTAKKTLALTLASPGAGLAQYADQVKQAQLNVATAQQKYNELTLDGTRLQKQDLTAHKQGVELNPAVVQAKQQLADANHKLAEAQTNVTVTAEKNAIALQQAANSAAGAGGGLNAYQQALAKLNPLQRQFVDFLITLKPLFDQLKTAASSFLPGLTQGIKNALPAFGPVLGVVSAVGKALGDSLNRIFSQFNTPAGRQFAAFLTKELPQQIGFLTTLFIQFGRIFASVWQAAGPLITAAEKAIIGFFSHVNTSAAGNGLSKFFNSLIPVMPQIATTLTALGGLIGNIFKALAPAIGPVLGLITNIANAISTLISGPVGQDLVRLFDDLIAAVTPLIPLLVNIAQTVLPPLLQGLDLIVSQGIAPFVAALAKDLAPLMPVIGQAISELVKALAPFIVQLIQALIPVLPQIINLFIGFLKAVTPLIGPLGNLLAALTPLIGPLTQLATQFFQIGVKLLPLLIPLITPLIAIATPFVKALTPLVKVFSDIAGWVDHLVQGLKDLIELPGKVVNTLSSFGIGGGSLPGNIQNAVNQIAAANSVANSGPNSRNPAAPRAVGGPVLAGHLYRVNEFGDESFFSPQVNGQILNAHDTARLKSMSNNIRNNYFNVYGAADPAATAHAVANRMAARGV